MDKRSDVDDRDPRDADHNGGGADSAPLTRRDEIRSFLFFTIAMAPMLAVLLVAGYGFVVWMIQLIAGPPVG